jgi:hypothetical protein
MKKMAILAAVVFLAGCSGPFVMESPTETSGYLVITATVDSVPDGAGISYNNSTLSGDSLLKGIIEDTYEQEGLTRDLAESEHDRLQSELSDVPRYDGDEFGYYFEYRNTTIRVRVVVEE